VAVLRHIEGSNQGSCLAKGTFPWVAKWEEKGEKDVVSWVDYEP
jgi:hypothetical protein